MSNLLSSLLGWLGTFVEWIFDWVPRYEIVNWNERGVHYFMGREPVEWEPGVHWYILNLSEVVKHHTNRMVLYIEPLALETEDGLTVEVGLVLTYHVTDVLVYEVANFDADESMHEVAQGALQDIVTGSTWEALRAKTEDGSRLGNKLAKRMDRALERFGVAVESARPTHQVRLCGAQHVFGVSLNSEILPTS